MARLSIDIERGVDVQKPGLTGNSASATPALSILRRRKGIVLILAVSLTLILFLNASTLSATTSSSFRWMKDSMSPPTSNAAVTSPSPSPWSPPPPQAKPLPEGPLPNAHGLDVAQAAAIEQAHALAGGSLPGSGTDALRKFAAEMGLPADALKSVVIDPNAKPSHAEQVLVFLQALSNPTYSVPSSESEWRKQLLPETADDLRRTLSQVELDGGKADLELFKTSRPRWGLLHQSRHPLTVFSKSYCPFSKRAKQLLNSMGATYTVYEVDLRDDAHSLQAALAAISGHRTFPTVFARDQLLGGSDDLANLDRLKILPGLLKGAGAL